MYNTNEMCKWTFGYTQYRIAPVRHVCKYCNLAQICIFTLISTLLLKVVEFHFLKTGGTCYHVQGKHISQMCSIRSPSHNVRGPESTCGRDKRTQDP